MASGPKQCPNKRLTRGESPLSPKTLSDGDLRGQFASSVSLSTRKRKTRAKLGHLRSQLLISCLVRQIARNDDPEALAGRTAVEALRVAREPLQTEICAAVASSSAADAVTTLDHHLGTNGEVGGIPAILATTVLKARKRARFIYFLGSYSGQSTVDLSARNGRTTWDLQARKAGC